MNNTGFKIKRVKIINGKLFYDEINNPKEHLGVMIKTPRFGQMFIDQSFIEHFHKKLESFKRYNVQKN